MDFLEVYWTDVYKTGHKPMLPAGSTLMNSNLTPRTGKYANYPESKGVYAVLMQKVVRKMNADWKKNFFDHPIEEILEFGEDMTTMLMLNEPFDVSHIIDLHKLGYLPLRIKAIPEGSFLPYKVPMFTIENTAPLNGTIVDWLVNYLETILSAESWQGPTAASLGAEYRKVGLEYILKTAPEMKWFLDYQFHDFSMRGLGGKSAIINVGLGFAMTTRGSDTLPVIPASRMYYDVPKGITVINSVIASEHAIMCSLTGFFLFNKKNGTWEKIGELEIETFRYLLKKFPSGILSLVSDTWDLWRVITEYCVILKEEIMARDGKLVIRPDSGDPVDIVCGEPDSKGNIYNELAQTGFDLDTLIEELSFLDIEDRVDHCIDSIRDYFQTKFGPLPYAEKEDIAKSCEKSCDKFIVDNKIFHLTYAKRPDGEIYAEVYYAGKAITQKTIQEKGVIEALWEVFGGTESTKGYKILDSHIGAIYGDSITLDRATRIFERLEKKGFASCNIVLGVGSYSLQMVTRDTHGFAQKATYIEVEGHGIEIFKDPVTDSGMKKSAKGLLRVNEELGGSFYLKDQCTRKEEQGGFLVVIFEDGEFYNEVGFEEVRNRIWDHVEMLVNQKLHVITPIEEINTCEGCTDCSCDKIAEDFELADKEAIEKIDEPVCQDGNTGTPMSVEAEREYVEEKSDSK
jgi:nicotinamide phosphoribosyltransferase